MARFDFDFGLCTVDGKSVNNHCRYCGKKVASGEIYCSEKCSKIYATTTRRETVKCALCGKSFEINKRFGSRRYCSQKCADASSSAKKLEYMKRKRG